MKKLSLFNFSVILMLTVFIMIYSQGRVMAEGVNNEKSYMQKTIQLVLLYGVAYTDISGMKDDNIKDAKEIVSLNDPEYYSLGKTKTNSFFHFGEAEVRFFYHGIGLGITPLSFFIRYGDNNVETTINKSYDRDFILSKNLDTIRFAATLYYSYSIDENSCLLFGLGLGAYSAFLWQGTEGDIYNEPSWLGEKYDELVFPYGFACEMKVEYNRDLSNTKLIVGLVARYVKFSEFKDEYGNEYSIKSGFTGVHLYAGIGL